MSYVVSEMATVRFAQRLTEARRRAGLTQDEVAALTRKTRQAVSKWERGEAEPSHEDLLTLAAAFGVSVAYLLGETDDPTPPSALDREKLPLTKRIPLVGCVAAGTPILAEENIEGLIPLPEGVDADFALRVRGDSMLRPDGLGLRDGQIVFCASVARRAPEAGNMVVALIDGEATIKWLLRDSDGTWYLRASNPRYRDIPLKSQHDRIQAVVVAVLGMMPQYPGEIAAGKDQS